MLITGHLWKSHGPTFVFCPHLKLTIKAPKLVKKCPKMVKIAIITLDLGSSASITYNKKIQNTKGTLARSKMI